VNFYPTANEKTHLDTKEIDGHYRLKKTVRHSCKPILNQRNLGAKTAIPRTAKPKFPFHLTPKCGSFYLLNWTEQVASSRLVRPGLSEAIRHHKEMRSLSATPFVLLPTIAGTRCIAPSSRVLLGARRCFRARLRHRCPS